MTTPWKIELFDGKGSFTMWQTRVKDLLIQQGYDAALEKEKPEDMKDKDWKTMVSRCMSTIRLSIADNILNNVSDADSAASLWEKLEAIYLAKSLSNILHLKRRLYRLRMEEGGNLVEHLNAFNGILNQLKKVDEELKEVDKALLLLSSLPDSFDNLVTTMLMGKTTSTLKVEEVQAALISHETHKKTNVVKSGESALAVQTGNHGRTPNRTGDNSRRSSGSGGGGVRCYVCNEMGHVRRYCPNRKNQNGGGAHVVHDYGDALLTSTYMEFRLAGDLPDSTGSGEDKSRNQSLRRRVTFALEPQTRVIEYPQEDDEQAAGEGGGGESSPPSGVDV